MPDRDPTPGELRIMLTSLGDILREIKDQMATKDFVNAKLDGFNSRVVRLENDVKDLTKSSSAAHVKLDSDSQARQEALRSEFNGRLDALEAEQSAQEQALKAQRNSRVQAITITVLGSIFSVAGSILAAGIVGGMFPR